MKTTNKNGANTYNKVRKISLIPKIIVIPYSFEVIKRKVLVNYLIHGSTFPFVISNNNSNKIKTMKKCRSNLFRFKNRELVKQFKQEINSFNNVAKNQQQPSSNSWNLLWGLFDDEDTEDEYKQNDEEQEKEDSISTSNSSNSQPTEALEQQFHHPLIKALEELKSKQQKQQLEEEKQGNKSFVSEHSSLESDKSVQSTTTNPGISSAYISFKKRILDGIQSVSMAFSPTSPSSQQPQQVENASITAATIETTSSSTTIGDDKKDEIESEIQKETTITTITTTISTDNSNKEEKEENIIVNNNNNTTLDNDTLFDESIDSKSSSFFKVSRKLKKLEVNYEDEDDDSLMKDDYNQ